MNNFIQTKIDPSMKFIIPPIQEERVHELLADLNEHKTTSLDGVLAKLLRLVSPVITRSITKIIVTHGVPQGSTQYLEYPLIHYFYE